jgi:hydrogenase maturation protease
MSVAVRVLGVGSPFGDDRLGWAAVEALRRTPWLAALPAGSVEMEACDRPGAALLSAWRDAQHVMLIDAVRSGAVPGTLFCLQGRELSGAATFSTHDFGVAAALALARSLGEDTAHILLLGIEADPACRGDQLSPAVAAAMPLLLERVEHEARQWMMRS